MKLLSLIEMTVSGGVLILAVMLVRALVLDKLPKRAFLVLWALAAARLLVPVGVPSALSVWTLAEEPLRQEAPPPLGRMPSPRRRRKNWTFRSGRQCGLRDCASAPDSTC